MTGGMDTVRERSNAIGRRVGVSIATFFGATIAVILWLFLFAGGFGFYQNIAVIVVIVLAFVAVMGVTRALGNEA